MHPREIRIENYTYDLPEARIAKYPLPERDLSKLLVYRAGKISEDNYRNISAHIPENSLLIFNNTKVVHARLFFETEKGARVEIFCLEPADEIPDLALAMGSRESVRFKCLVGKANKWKEKTLAKKEGDFILTAKIAGKTSDSFIIEFNWQPEQLTFAEVLDKAGMVPIPPYLKRQSEAVDLLRYQTIYAEHEGSVAAPTAGLHFTGSIFESLKKKNIRTDYVTLHVGAGTFKPVKSETMQDHEMHPELIDVKIETVENLLNSLQQNIISVGTTAMRTLESLYWMGVKAKRNPEAALQELEIMQWDVYEEEMRSAKTFETGEVLEALIIWMKKNNLERLNCKTQIIIAPGYEFKIANALITNFHQPGSTLLLLVAALAGDDWKRIYEYALSNDFRFLSYGDGCLLFRR